MTKQEMTMILMGREIERMACGFGDDSSEHNTISKSGAEEILAMVRACKVGNEYYTVNIKCLQSLIFTIGSRFEPKAQQLIIQANYLCIEYLKKVA